MDSGAWGELAFVNSLGHIIVREEIRDGKSFIIYDRKDNILPKYRNKLLDSSSYTFCAGDVNQVPPQSINEITDTILERFGMETKK